MLTPRPTPSTRARPRSRRSTRRASRRAVVGGLRRLGFIHRAERPEAGRARTRRGVARRRRRLLGDGGEEDVHCCRGGSVERPPAYCSQIKLPATQRCCKVPVARQCIATKLGILSRLWQDAATTHNLAVQSRLAAFSAAAVRTQGRWLLGRSRSGPDARYYRCKCKRGG